MRAVLALAAVYNIVWGTLAVLMPLTICGWCGLHQPLYPQLMQCIGMIVGVYGVGYAIAARNPYRHWPIVLVGLLGKIFGPIGFIYYAIAGELPVSMVWMLVTNDFIWWIPFAVILWKAAEAHQAQSERLLMPRQKPLVDPLKGVLSQRGASLYELSRQSPVLVVFLRHSGCTFCREAMADLARQRSEIEAAGTQIALVHMGQQDPMSLLERNQLTDLHRFRDPMCHLYDAFRLPHGTFRQLLGLKVWYRGARAFFAGHGMGALNGNGFRMPGVFLMENGEVVRSFRHQTAADRPNYAAIAKPNHEPALSH